MIKAQRPKVVEWEGLAASQIFLANSSISCLVWARYATPDYNQELGCYSSPDVKCRGVTTGDALNNNVAVLNENAFRMSDIGDESGICAATTVSPTTTTSMTTTTATGEVTLIRDFNPWMLVNKTKADLLNNIRGYVKSRTNQKVYY